MANSVRGGLWLGLLLCPAVLVAQTNRPPLFPANRYLLVVETSRAMLSRSEALVKAVQDLLNSALARQARPGDTLGVWTFDDQLHTGLIPLQQWAPGNQSTITERVTGLLRAEKFENKADFERLIPGLQHVLKTSPFLTVILVCSGEDEIHGTPFDERINDYFKSWHQQQVEARAPFVIALRAQSDRLVDYSMTAAPWPAELPGLPKELFTPVPASPITKAPATKAAPVVPPLIVIGKKHETAPTPANASAAGPTSQAASAMPANPAPVLATARPDSQPPQPNPPATPGAAGRESGPPRDTSPPPPTPTPPSNPAADRVTSAANARLTSPATGEPETSPGERQTGRSNAPVIGLMADALSPADAQAKSAPANVATAAPMRRPAGTWVLALTVVGLIAAAVAAVCVWWRRSRIPSEPSLITESFDRHKR